MPAETGWALALAAGGTTVVAGRRIVAFLRHRQILDHPNDRSSHSLPTPRGGGLATTPILAAGLGLSVLLAPGPAGWLAIGAMALLAISWVDDRRGLPPLPRFGAHALTIAAFLAFLPADSLVFGGLLPSWADRLLTGLGWLWFVNLYNFMDGIDGITGVETGSLGAGIAIVAALTGAPMVPASLVVAAVGLGFLSVNWHPARVFLGDSGSVPFGYVLGGLLVLLAAHGQLAAALILPGYYLADATITLVRRALAGEKVWQAHRKHFYQRAVQGGKRHDQVALLVLAGDLALIAAACMAAAGLTWAGVASAVAVVAAMLGTMQHWSKGRPA